MQIWKACTKSQISGQIMMGSPGESNKLPLFTVLDSEHFPSGCSQCVTVRGFGDRRPLAWQLACFGLGSLTEFKALSKSVSGPFPHIPGDFAMEGQLTLFLARRVAE